jgi:hypothetical protein
MDTFVMRMCSQFPEFVYWRAIRRAHLINGQVWCMAHGFCSTGWGDQPFYIWDCLVLRASSHD